MRSKNERRIARQLARRPGYRRQRSLIRAYCRQHDVPFAPHAPAARYVKWEPRVSQGKTEPVLAGFIGGIREQIRGATTRHNRR